MAVSALGVGGPRAAAGAAPAPRRQVEAMLRWRVRWLGAELSRPLHDAARLFPVLLHASFDHPRLRDEPPGVAGLRYRRSWARWARRFGLPPPWRAQRGTCLTEAVMAVSGPTGLEMLVIGPPGLRHDELLLLGRRLEAARQALAAAGVPVRYEFFDSARLSRWGQTGLKALLSGALVAGRLSPGSWTALEAAGAARVDPPALAALAEASRSPLGALAFLLMAGGPVAGPLHALGRSPDARRLADPAVAAVTWAQEAAGLRDPLQRALALCGPGGGPGTPPPERAAAELLALGRQLSLAALRAVRRSRLCRRAPRCRDVLGPGIPRALLPRLGHLIEKMTRAGALELAPVPSGRVHEVRIAPGARLGRGATPVQARVRAIALAAQARGEAIAVSLEPHWAALAARLAPPWTHPTLLAVVEPGAAAEPPFDPLNSGARRELAFPAALLVRLWPGRPPGARVAPAEDAVAEVLRAAAAGTAVEVLAAHSQARPLAARLTRTAALLRDAGSGESDPVAVEAGGRVFLADGPRLRRYPLRRFLERPRRFRPDPDAPDLALSPGERHGIRWSTPALVQCRLSLLGGDRVAVLLADGSGQALRETVPVSVLESHLRDTRAVLKAADPAALLALRLCDDVEAAVRRASSPGRCQEVSVEGELPFGLTVVVGGERFGGPGAPGWAAAAQAVLAGWAPGDEGYLGVARVSVRAAGEPARGLLALYARSVVLRRLDTHLARAQSAYRRASPGRRGE